MSAYEFCLMDPLWAEHGLTQPSAKCMFPQCKLLTKMSLICYYNYMLRASFSSLRCQTAGKKKSLSTRDPQFEVMYYSYNPMVMKRVWGKHPHKWPVHSGQVFSKETETNVWEAHYGAHYDYLRCWRDSTGFVAPVYELRDAEFISYRKHQIQSAIAFIFIF